MRRSRRNVLAVIVIAICALLIALAACGGSKKVKLSFETFGADPVETITAKVGDEVDLPAPEWEGHSFEGWYDNESFDGTPVTKVTAEKNTTFYAKWETLYSVALSLGGGSLDAPAILLKAGENIYEAVKDYEPTLTGHLFGEWLMDGAPLGETAVMPAANVTLTAHYKVAYTVQVWLQNKAQDGYERGEDITGFDYAAQSYTPAVSVHGFEVVDHDGQNRTHALGENAADNVFVFYLNREQMTLTLISNYLDDTPEERETVSFTYGDEIELPYDRFRAEGHLLAGWSHSPAGVPEYVSHVVEGLLRNGDGVARRDVFTIEDGGTLYAIWTEGSRDLFGGEDVIFHSDADPAHVILLRCGDYYQGQFYSNSQMFTFALGNGESLQGKLFDGGFAYSDVSRQGRVYYRYQIGSGISEAETISLDDYNGITYTNVESSVGTYYLDEDGIMVATFTSGPLRGETLKLLAGYVSSGNRRVFIVQEESVVERGTMYRFALRDGQPVFYPEAYLLTMDGFGNAVMNMGTSSTAYLYQVYGEGQYFYLYTASSGSLYGSYLFVDDMGDGSVFGYTVYDSGASGTYTAEGGATLTLDGGFKAVYTSASGKREEGYFSAIDSAFGGKVVSFYNEDGTMTHLFRAYRRNVPVEGSSNTYTMESVLEEKNAAYAEYYYHNERSNYYTPLLVIEDGEKASVYGYTSEREFVKAAEGTYSYNAETGRYGFTVQTLIETEKELILDPVDVTRLKSFVYSTGVDGSLNVSYWYSVTYNEEEPTAFDKKYTDGKGGTLYLVSGFAVYEAADTESSAAGVYRTLSGYEKTTIRVTVGSSYLYFEIEEGEEGADGTFLQLETPIGSVSERLADGTTNSNSRFTFDGKGGGTLSVTEGEGEPVVTTGTYTVKQETTQFETTVYHFAPTDGTEGFDFVLLSTSSTTYFTRLNGDVAGELTSEKDGTLVLDGYSYLARYTLPEGEAEEGQNDSVLGLYVVKDNTVEFTVALTNGGSYVFYFDLVEEDHTKFTLRGGEAGTYLRFENEYISGEAYRLDGYGGLTVLFLGNEESEEIGHGSYKIEGGVCTLTYTDNAGGEHTVEGILGSYTVSSTRAYRVFIIEQEEIVRKYIDEDDWSVFEPDGRGNATVHTQKGAVERGMYVIITEDLLYYANSAGTDACLYRYDDVHGTVKKIVYSQRSYYTSDLRSLQFSRYGFMIMDGVTRYYYTLTADGKITTYLQDPENDAANKYGFVVGDLGTFADKITVDGKEYINNNGVSIQCLREEATKSEYPVLYSRDEQGNETKVPLGLLSFQPTGEDEFSVVGAVELEVNGEKVTMQCNVVREMTEAEEGGEKTYNLYVLIGYYRFGIDLTYKGERNSEYRVTDLSYIISAYNGNYYDVYYMLYYFAAMFGATIDSSMLPPPSTYGTIQIVREYGADGEQTKQYINVDLGENVEVVLTDGTAVTSLEHAPYEYLEIDEDTGYYVVEQEGADGEKYKYYFSLAQNTNFRVTCFYLVACTRLETLESGNYRAEIECVVATDASGVRVGNAWDIRLYENDVEIVGESFYALSQTQAYLIVREREHAQGDLEGVNTGKITSTKYYVFTLTKQPVEQVGSGDDGEGGDMTEGGTEDAPLAAEPKYQSFTVEVREVETIYLAGGFAYVDIFTDKNEVAGFRYNGVQYFAASSEYDEDTKTYTVTTTGGARYEIAITETANGKQATLKAL